jgi:hypothetical protein
MIQLNPTKYPTNIRTVSSLIPVTQSIYRDDVVLNCDSSTGAINLTLLGIPKGFWSTQYKLYIIDFGNNSSTNNITINAGNGVDPTTGLPVAQTINGASSVTLNVNGGSVLIRAIDNYKYSATFSNAGGGYDRIQDEGVNLPQRKIINFVGAGVTATDDALNQKTIVTIPGAVIIPITYAQSVTLVSTNSLQPGGFYYITDASSTYVQNGVIVQALTNNTFSINGVGNFLNADYNGVGNYSSTTPTYSGTNYGIWANNLPTSSIGDVVVYDNRNYINLTGVNGGTPPPADMTNYSLLVYDVTKGYIREWDIVKYDWAIDTITFRADKSGNEVELSPGVAFSLQPLSKFQWGRASAYNNKIIGASGFEATNSRLLFYGNTLNNGFYRANTRYNVNQGTFRYNQITENGEVVLNAGIGDVFCLIENNLFCGNKPGTFTIEDATSGSIISQNRFVNSSTTITSLKGSANLSYNSIMDNSILTIVSEITTNGRFFGNTVNSGATLNIDVLDNEMRQCEISNHFLKFTTIGKQITKKALIGTMSTFELELDMDDALIFNAGTLFLNFNNLGFGDITLINSTGKTISKINLTNTGTDIFRRFYPESGSTVTYQHTLVAAAVAQNLLCDAPASANLLTGRVLGTDYIEYRTQGSIPNYVHLRNNLVLLA